jgi:hypothetical protein
LATPHTTEFIGKKLKDIEYNGKYLIFHFEGNMKIEVGRVGESDFFFTKKVEGSLADKLDEEHQRQKKKGKREKSKKDSKK